MIESRKIMATGLGILFLSSVFPNHAYAQEENLPAIEQGSISKSGGNSWTSYPEALCNLRNVKSIFVRNQDFANLPSCIANHAITLDSLSVENNKIQALPSEIGALNNVQTAEFSKNNLTALPPSIGDMHSLQILSLDENQLTELPSELGKLTGLTSLNLSSNSLSSLPDSLANLTNLSELNLAGNNLTEIPTFLPYLISLKTINLRGNPLPPGSATTLQIIYSGREVQFFVDP